MGVIYLCRALPRHIVEEEPSKSRNLISSENRLPKNAVLLIPEPEGFGEQFPYSIVPGYYNGTHLLDLLEKHREDAAAIGFIADMLETGNPADDEFANLLKENSRDPSGIARIVRNCRSCN